MEALKKQEPTAKRERKPAEPLILAGRIVRDFKTLPVPERRYVLESIGAFVPAEYGSVAEIVKQQKAQA